MGFKRRLRQTGYEPLSLATINRFDITELHTYPELKAEQDREAERRAALRRKRKRGDDNV